MTPFLYGKHPAFGDFISYGGDGALISGLDRWLERVLPPIKAELGPAWAQAWSSAPPLRFWLGAEVLGRPAQGLFLASRDRVGRAYPLIVGLTDVAFVPPTDPRHSEAPYDALWNHILRNAPPSATKFGGAAELLDGFDPVAGAAFEWSDGQESTVWGHRTDGDLPRLFADARGVDAARAQYRRSHWWHPATGPRAAGWMGADGLPDTAAMKWLLTERWMPVVADAPEVAVEIVAPETDEDPSA